MIIKLKLFGIRFSISKNKAIVTARANENWHDLVEITVKKGYWGLENLSFIPGSVGASPVQNIGAYGVELKDVFVSCKVFDMKENKFTVLKNKDCKFAYRYSIFKKFPNRYIILEIKLRLSKTKKSVLDYKPLDKLKARKDLEVKDISNLVIETRKEKLPDYNKFPNCGSFFKNPIINKETLSKLETKFPNIPFFTFGKKFKVPAGWFIEYIAKMKGEKINGVGTWKNQALVLVNYENKDIEELEDLIKIIKNKIKSETGITLEQEVNFVH